MKMGLESKRGLTRYLQARAYCRAAKEALRLTMSDKARDATRTSSSVLEIDHDRVTGVALSLCKVYLSCKDAFPTPQMKDEWGVAIWREACTRTGANPDSFIQPELFTDSNTKLITETKTRVKDAVEEFCSSPVPASRDPAAFNVTWFRNSAGDGVVYHEQFSPVPVPAIAFVLTVIECCIDEWAGGLHQETGWDEERFKTVYRSHISSLGDFQRHAIGDTLEHIQSDLLKEARQFPSSKHADVPPVPITKLRGFTQTL
ncbi:hypothetical protein EDB86DRAFT_3101364 [Lactarius hatsudake]|nr:hypothetical protein EDB86DRAFT_3101364 [Lactarius hatsudake]